MAQIPTKEVPLRLMRGLRPSQPQHVSDDLFQLLLTCWQTDLDERPSFEEIQDYLKELCQESQEMQVNFKTWPHFTYESYQADLELK